MGLFSRELTRLRLDVGLSPTDLAGRLPRATPSAVWQWEEGRTLPSRGNIVALEKVFGVEGGSLAALVEADRTARKLRKNAPANTPPAGGELIEVRQLIREIAPRRMTVRPVSRPKTSEVSLDRFDDVDDLIFMASTQIQEHLAAIDANNQRVQELNREARRLIDNTETHPDHNDVYEWVTQSHALLDQARRLLDENKELSAAAQTERNRALRLIQRTRHIVEGDHAADTVPTAKVIDVLKRRLVRRTADRRRATKATFDVFEEATPVWFTPQATPDDVRPLVWMIQDLVGRVEGLESMAVDLKVSLETERAKNQTPPTIDVTPPTV
jgi:transcriptional regulator with XRE-family HTH domain